MVCTLYLILFCVGSCLHKYYVVLPVGILDRHQPLSHLDLWLIVPVSIKNVWYEILLAYHGYVGEDFPAHRTSPIIKESVQDESQPSRN